VFKTSDAGTVRDAIELRALINDLLIGTGAALAMLVSICAMIHT
jgi:hypothetical protein